MGATGSLGAYVTERLLTDGWSVVGTCSRAIEGTPPAGYELVRLDLAGPRASEELSAVFEQTAPNLILHAAVTYGDPRNPPAQVKDLERMFRINAFALYTAIRTYCVKPDLAPFCSCIIVNSDSIYHAGSQTAAYAASKAALRILTAALADSCRTANVSVATLLLGPLADTAKRAHLAALANKRGVTERALTREYLRRSNPFLVIDDLIDLDACYESVRYIVTLGKTANGMLCKLDGGSSGSLV